MVVAESVNFSRLAATFFVPSVGIMIADMIDNRVLEGFTHFRLRMHMASKVEDYFSSTEAHYSR